MARTKAATTITKTLKRTAAQITNDADAPRKKSKKAEAGELWAHYTGHVPSATQIVATPPSSQADPFASPENRPCAVDAASTSVGDVAALKSIQTRIATDATLTSFRQHALFLLTQIPRGQYSTYKALSEGIARTVPPSTVHKTARRDGGATGKSSARAVGNAMRTNPYAPTVPCHRVLAADRKLGGFKGSWGEDGTFAGEKKRLLKEEGVRFDAAGKALGSPFVGFVDCVI